MKNDKKSIGSTIGRIWSQYSFIFVLFIIMIGYAITISEKGVTLKRSRYGAVGSSSFEAVPAWAEATQGSLHIEVRGNRVDVYLPGVDEPLVSLEDAKPLTHGAYGFWSTGKELSVLDCTISPLD